MEESYKDQNLDMLCSCCDNHTFCLPDVEGISAAQRKNIEDLCKICIENFALIGVKRQAQR